MGNGWVETPSFCQLSDDVLLRVFEALNYSELTNVSEVSQRWFRVANDEYLWKRLFVSDFKLSEDAVLSNSFGRPDDALLTWHSEYKRLKWESPVNLSEIVKGHDDEVLHVTFSQDGSLMGTCSKDCTVKIWSCGSDLGTDTRLSPLLFFAERNLHEMLRWRYTQFSQFNESADLILVSGVHFGKGNTGGEIVIFAIDKSANRLSFRCRVMNRPYDVFGCWFDRNHVLNGELFTVGLLNSASHLWLCKASQESTSERTAVLAPLCKFLNRNGANLRMVLVSGFVSSLVEQAVYVVQKILQGKRNRNSKSKNLEPGDLPKSLTDYLTHSEFSSANERQAAGPSSSPMGYSTWCDNCRLNHMNEEIRFADRGCTCICHGAVENKLLIFSTGSEAYTPHQVAFKLIRAKEVLQRLNAEVMSDERREEVLERLRIQKLRKEKEEAEAKKRAEIESQKVLQEPETPQESEPIPPAPEPIQMVVDNVIDEPEESDHEEGEVDDGWEDLMAQFDVPDHVIDMHGHVIGMALTHDQRYLMVNVRAWPENYVIEDPFHPPQLAQEIQVRVINMENLSLLPEMYEGHKGFTPNEECFFLFLNANKGYVASGSEDKQGYVWSRDYGCLVGNLGHKNVVNSVAFNPRDPEMLVSVSDDHSIKVWRSKRKMRECALKEEVLKEI